MGIFSSSTRLENVAMLAVHWWMTGGCRSIDLQTVWTTDAQLRPRISTWWWNLVKLFRLTEVDHNLFSTSLLLCLISPPLSLPFHPFSAPSSFCVQYSLISPALSPLYNYTFFQEGKSSLQNLCTFSRKSPLYRVCISTYMVIVAT